MIIAGSGVGIAAAVTEPELPVEQQALLDMGYTKAAFWARFDKQNGDCHITVMQVGVNYYVTTSGKLKATLYPVIPTQVVAGATLLDANCQGPSKE